MPRPPGRLVSSCLSESEKLAECREDRSALLYCLTLPQHDGEGRLQVDDVSMLDMAGRYAITHGWTVRDMPPIRGELARVGLWRLYETTSGKLCAEVVGWEKHQRKDRIKRGSNLMEESRGIRGTDNGDGYAGDTSTVQSPSEVKSREGKERKEKAGSARAREEQEMDPRPEFSGSRKQEAGMITPAVVAAFKKAHPLGEGYTPTQYDLEAIQRFAHRLAEIKDLEGFFRRLMPELRTKKLERAIEQLNDPARNNGNGKAPEPMGPPTWLEEARKVDPEYFKARGI